MDPTPTPTPAPTPEPTPTPTPEPTPTPTPAPEPADEAQLPDAVKAILKKNRDAVAAAEKAQRTAEAKAKQFEDRDKTELQLANETATAAQQRAADAERVSAALRAGLPVEMAARLQGDTAEALLADATQLATQLGAPAPPDFDGGQRPPAPKKSLDDQIAELEAKGDWAAVGRLKAQKLAGAKTTT